MMMMMMTHDVTADITSWTWCYGWWGRWKAKYLMIVNLVMICGSETWVDTSSCCQSSCVGCHFVELVFRGFWLDSWGKQGRMTQIGTSVIQGWLRLVDAAANPITWLRLSWVGFGFWTENMFISYSVRVWTYIIVTLGWKLEFIFKFSVCWGKEARLAYEIMALALCLPSG